MKWLLALLVLSTQAFAVEVKNCPAKINFKISDLKTKITASELLSTLGPGELETEEINAVNETYSNIASVVNVERSFILSAARNGRCVYQDRHTMEKVEIFTKSKKDTFMTQTNIGPRGILLRTYVAIDKLTPSEVKFSKIPSLAIAIPRWPYESYTAGGELKFIGYALNLSIQAKK